MTFLDSRTISDAISTLLENSGEVQAAVSYWGQGAVDRLKLQRNAGKITIVCDLLSGACNPDEIELLIDTLGKRRVLTCSGLHAKVWLGDAEAIVGSSNASTNGLAEEGVELSGALEANLLVRDGAVLSTLKQWYDQKVLPDAKVITTDDLKVARSRWNARRRILPPPKARSLLDALKFNPKRGADAFVWIYPHEVPSVWANQTRKRERERRKNGSLDFWENAGARFRPGAHVFDFDSSDGRIEFDGEWLILTDDPVVKEGRRSLLLCKPAKPLWSLRRGSMTAWTNAASRAADSRRNRVWEGTLEKFARTFLSADT